MDRYGLSLGKHRSADGSKFTNPAKVALYGFLKNVPAGTTVSFEELSRVAGQDLRLKKNKSLVTDVTRRLLGHNRMVVIPVRGVGYLHCNFDQVLAHVRRREESARRQMAWADELDRIAQDRMEGRA